MKYLFVINSTVSMSGASKVIRFVASKMAEISQFRDNTEIEIISVLDKKLVNKINECRYQYCLGCDDSKKGIWRIDAIRKIRKIVRESKPDIICAFVSDICVTVRLATLGMNVKLICCDRGDPRADGPMWSKLSGWSYRHSDACVFQLETVRDFFGEEKLKRSYVIPNPFVPSDVEVVNFESREKTVISTGRFTDQKGYDYLLKAFSEVCRKHPDYKLVLYGDGPLRSEYEKLISEYHLEDHVEMPGFIKDVGNTIKNAGIFCLSSRYEGIPNSLLEAMSLGIPAVATDCTPGGAKFLTDNGKRGILVPLGDTEAIAAGINQLIEDRSFAESMSRKEMEVRKLFAPDIIAKQWQQVFADLS